MRVSTESVTFAAPPARVLALGDSLTAGYGLPASDAFPAVLQAKISGLCGNPSYGNRARSKKDGRVDKFGAGLRSIVRRSTRWKDKNRHFNPE